ncbi:hypothetical protein CG015_17055 [Vibrio anguillarum]|nr:hypothetical protein CG015_17055 [Vibrio anguillarum]
MTKRLRQIRNAWHFGYELAFVFTAQWFRSGGNVAHYLTRRYATQVNLGLNLLDFSGHCFVLSANELFYPQIRG